MPGFRPGIKFIFHTSVSKTKQQASKVQHQGLKKDKRKKYIRNILRCFGSEMLEFKGKVRRDKVQKEKNGYLSIPKKIESRDVCIHTHIYIHKLIDTYTYIHTYSFEMKRKDIE